MTTWIGGPGVAVHVQKTTIWLLQRPCNNSNDGLMITTRYSHMLKFEPTSNVPWKPGKGRISFQSVSVDTLEHNVVSSVSCLTDLVLRCYLSSPSFIHHSQVSSKVPCWSCTWFAFSIWPGSGWWRSSWRRYRYPVICVGNTIRIDSNERRIHIFAERGKWKSSRRTALIYSLARVPIVMRRSLSGLELVLDFRSEWCLYVLFFVFLFPQLTVVHSLSSTPVQTLAVIWAYPTPELWITLFSFRAL